LFVLLVFGWFFCCSCRKDRAVIYMVIKRER
jgi:hypothetical protein